MVKQKNVRFAFLYWISYNPWTANLLWCEYHRWSCNYLFWCKLV